jgi:CheY-like chemotaxis protein
MASDSAGKSLWMTETARPLILVVDDERALHPLYHELFADEGWTCLSWAAPDTPAAVAAVRPALVLADLVFGMDRAMGRRFIEALRSDPATDHLPVVCATADKHQLDEDRAWLAPLACSLLAKPFEIEQLITEIRRCLRWSPQPERIRPVAQ